MQSQDDIFATQTQTATQTQSQTAKKYDYLVLCNQDENVRHPFALYPRSMLLTREIPDKWVEAILDNSSRLKSLTTLEGLPGYNFSLFGKIEAGVSEDLRQAKVNDLNARYASMREDGRMSTSTTLYQLVLKYPYRLISSKSPKKVSFFDLLKFKFRFI